VDLLDLDGAEWSRYHDVDMTPRVALAAALHAAPIAGVRGRSLVCPVCHTADEIRQVNRGFQEYELSVDTDGQIFASAGDWSEDSSSFVCGACLSTVRLPRKVEDYS
jgi:hypothetical protein